MIARPAADRCRRAPSFKATATWMLERPPVLSGGYRTPGRAACLRAPPASAHCTGDKGGAPRSVQCRARTPICRAHYYFACADPPRARLCSTACSTSARAIYVCARARRLSTCSNGSCPYMRNLPARANADSSVHPRLCSLRSDWRKPLYSPTAPASAPVPAPARPPRAVFGRVPAAEGGHARIATNRVRPGPCMHRARGRGQTPPAPRFERPRPSSRPLRVAENSESPGTPSRWGLRVAGYSESPGIARAVAARLAGAAPPTRTESALPFALSDHPQPDGRPQRGSASSAAGRSRARTSVVARTPGGHGGGVDVHGGGVGRLAFIHLRIQRRACVCECA